LTLSAPLLDLLSLNAVFGGAFVLAAAGAGQNF